MTLRGVPLPPRAQRMRLLRRLLSVSSGRGAERLVTVSRTPPRIICP